MTQSGFSKQKNCLDPLRLYAAIAVMTLHYTGYALYVEDAGTGSLLVLRRIAESIPGLVIFLTISGFLAAMSLDRYDAGTFLKKKLLRLFPPVWLCTLVNLAVLAALGITFGRDILLWAITQLAALAWTPGSVSGFATGSINGTLWTVLVQFQLYIVSLLFFKRWKTKGPVFWGILIAAAAGLNIACAYLPGEKLLGRSFLPFLSWHLIGMAGYVFFDRLVPLLKKILPAVGIVLLVFSIGGFRQPGYYTGIVTGLSLALLVLSLGFLLPAVRIHTDISYDLFLYHWIVLNIFIHFDLMHRLPGAAGYLVFMAVSIAVSYAGHRIYGLIEKTVRKAVYGKAQN